MRKGSFSVSMCVYGQDDPRHFQNAVESVINQSVKPSEIVIVVDGPVPRSIELILQKCESDDLFKVIWLKENVGHGEARRVGLASCSFELVALMDADDISLPDRFEKQLAVFDANPCVSAVGGNISEFVRSKSNVVGRRIVPEEDAEIKEYMKRRCPMNQVTVMFRLRDVEAVGGYIDWYCEEDYYLWLRLSLAGMSFYNIQDDLVLVRVGDEMYQRRGGGRYFISEARLQNYMLKNRLISPFRYVVNIGERFIIQILLPNRVRGWVFQKLARE